MPAVGGAPAAARIGGGAPGCANQARRAHLVRHVVDRKRRRRAAVHAAGLVARRQEHGQHRGVPVVRNKDDVIAIWPGGESGVRRQGHRVLT